MKSNKKQNFPSKYYFFQNVLDAMADLVYIVNKDNEIEYINPAMKRAFGPIKNKKCYEYLADLSKPCPWCRQRKVLNGQTIRWEWYCRKKDKIYDVIETPLNYADDRILKLKIMRDVTDLRKWEKRLKESETRYKLAQKAAHIGTWDWDIKSGKLIWSEEIESIFGLPKGTFQNDYNDFVKLVHPEDRKKVQQAIDRCIEVGEDYDVQHRIIWPDGSIHWLREIGNVIRDRNQLAVRMLGVVQDITEQKKTRELLETAKNGLERHVRKRTKELEKLNEILQQEVAERKNYQEQLHSLMKRMNQMEEQERKKIATGLHDRIVQSLALTKIKLEDIIDKNENKNLQESLEDIYQLVDQNINEIRSLTFEISPPVLYEMGLIPAIEWLSENLSKKYELEIHIKDETGSISLDDTVRNIIFQSVRELLNNIYQHADANQVFIHISKDNDCIVIRVEDDGRGFKVDGVKPDMSHLTGFGLFNIKERIKSIKGMCRITSAKNQGTTAVISAPLKKADQDDR